MTIHEQSLALETGPGDIDCQTPSALTTASQFSAFQLSIR
jgi:hypothetical protein